MSGKKLKKLISAGLVYSLALIFSSPAFSSGIVLAGTRIIYPAGTKQITQSVRNTSDKNSYLVQSWVEAADGKKTTDFIVTPPLYVSKPGDDNIIRIMHTGKSLPADRESVYYFNAKSVPSVDKKALEGKNVLMIAAVTRIKLFVRPPNLKPSQAEAADLLTFTRADNKMTIKNPSPYYITLTDIKAGKTKLRDTMVAPFSEETVALPSGYNAAVHYTTINDYGAASSVKTALLQ
ncbi:fimbria/pilus periplasmic chaperone [Escherichia coli]